MVNRNKILQIVRQKKEISAREITQSFDISRNYANRLLHELRDEGEILLVGKTNQARYVLAQDTRAVKEARERIRHIFFRLKNKHLDESEIFGRVERETGIFIGAKDNIHRIVRHGFTEMVNNAIDHSRSPIIEIDCRRSETAITFTVRDFGIGIFNNVKDKFRLPGTLAAIQEILKGKTTTDKKNHTGEGVFFTSKIADVFIVDSFDKKLTVNNLLPDIFISDRKTIKGTRVSFSIHLSSNRTVQEVFNAFAGGDNDDFAFNKTRITVRLFQFGRDLPSRSEAKRVTMNLENFQEVELDFTGVSTVGQGFADEIFRVWHNRHPEVRLVPVNANEIVSFMVKRSGGNIA